jgi:hypothetical protein
MGALSLETVPGLKRHRRKAVAAALSRTGLPVLASIMTLLTPPLATSTKITATPLPVILDRLAS